MCGTARARAEGDTMIGTLVADRWLLKQRLGHGGSGTIYLAEHITLRRRVAVKVLHHELSRDDLAVERFRREATTVGEIDNEHIVEVHDFGRAPDGRLFLAMELLEGETLAESIKRAARLPISQVVDVLVQLGEALMEAHAMGYVHRDLRPRNIFLTRRRGREGFLKLLDFGLAKLVEREGEAAATSLGMTFGDPRYMSPEQARGEPCDRRADIYSLGVIAYEMLTGKPPFHGARVFDVLTAHLEEAPPAPSTVRNDVPRWLDAVVMRMLAKQPGDRFVTVYRLVEALKEGSQRGVIMSDEVARSTPVVTPPPPAPRSREMEVGKGKEKELQTAQVKAMPIAAIADAAASMSGPGPAANGMSGAWYADGEAAAQAEEELERQKTKPKKTRPPRDEEPPPSDSSNWDEPVYADDAERARKKKLLLYVGGGAGGVLFILVLVLAFSGGGGDKTAAAAPDAGEELIVPPPAAPPDAAPVAQPSPPDAGVKKTPPVKIVKQNGGNGGNNVTRPPDDQPRDDANAQQADFYVKLGRTALAKGDGVGAAAAFNKAREFDPKNAHAIAGLGEVALQQGMYEDAIVHLGAASRLAPRDVRILMLLANAYLGAERPKEAAATFRRVLKIDPNNGSAQKGLQDAQKAGG
jgi:tRNA A-37 threonylcarbamoyl transferase component Bud32